jgi:hypothetical protein
VAQRVVCRGRERHRPVGTHPAPASLDPRHAAEIDPIAARERAAPFGELAHPAGAKRVVPLMNAGVMQKDVLDETGWMVKRHKRVDVRPIQRLEERPDEIQGIGDPRH